MNNKAAKEECAALAFHKSLIGLSQLNALEGVPGQGGFMYGARGIYSEKSAPSISEEVDGGFSIVFRCAYFAGRTMTMLFRQAGNQLSAPFVISVVFNCK